MIRILALVAATIAGGLFVHVATLANMVSGSPAQRGFADMLWPVLPVIVLAWILWKARVPGAAFIASCIVVAFLIVSLTSSLSSSGNDAWMLETSWGLNNLVGWIGLGLVGLATIAEVVVRALIGRPARPGDQNSG